MPLLSSVDVHENLQGRRGDGRRRRDGHGDNIFSPFAANSDLLQWGSTAGRLVVPAMPGLGVELDRERLARLHQPASISTAA
ncbi:hypothetical protein PG994_005342 [Apiospora phragmitis]|uniref:Enolase C-terminal domain-containing protein n=1 Tax=Apiospora phragmitis TaxID=2905665 RepID=A0ABR1VBZ7_9PEZI